MAETIEQWINNLTDFEYQLLILAWLFLMVYLLWRGFRYYQHYRFVSDTPTSKISSAAQGYVELKGLGEMIPGPEIRSPFSQQRCLWYQCIVERKQKLKNSSQWIQHSNQVSDEIFFLRDDSGDCIVIPDGAKVIPSVRRRWSGNSPDNRSRAVHAGSGLASFLSIGEYRFTESLIKVADSLHVMGEFETRESRLSVETLRQQTDHVLKTWKQNPQRFLAPFDRNGDGKIDSKEWEQVKKQAELEVHKHHPHTDYHVIQKPAHGKRPFLISTMDEYEVIRYHHRRLAFFMLGFFSLLSLGWLLIQLRHA